jgi:hypothetical protein
MIKKLTHLLNTHVYLYPKTSKGFMKREPHAFKLMPEEPNPADDNLPSHIS